MASAASVASHRPNVKHFSAASTCCTAMSQSMKANSVKVWPSVSRRVGSIALISSLVLASTSNGTASGFEFRMTVPEQSVEEAEALIKGHVRGLLDVKSLLEAEDWREAQRELRQNSGYLRQDIYTIIQSKEGSVRPLLRNLYKDLFNNVTKLDYAARAKDVAEVWKCYNNITIVLDDILSRF